MTDPNFQRSIHSQAFWDKDAAQAQAMFDQFAGVDGESLTPEITWNVLVTLSERIGQVALHVEALALENNHTPAPRKRTPTKRLTVRANPERHTVHLLNKRMSVAEARNLGNLLLQAADAAEGGNNG
jgi:hypothetical protein